jgi:hypothetical protein
VTTSFILGRYLGGCVILVATDFKNAVSNSANFGDLNLKTKN